jgi:hypothetical protein
MNKRRLHHVWTTLRWIKPWYFLVLTIISAVICITALRDNNEHMLRLRDEVYAADKDNTDVASALQALQAYVTTHMNTNLSTGPNAVYPPIQLKYTYDRLVQAQADQAAASNSQLYTDAQNYCQSQIPTGFSGRYRVPCIEQYVQSHDTSLPKINDALYKFDFVTPVWSADLAGWSLLATAALALATVISFIGRRLLRRSTK